MDCRRTVDLQHTLLLKLGALTTFELTCKLHRWNVPKLSLPQNHGLLYHGLCKLRI